MTAWIQNIAKGTVLRTQAQALHDCFDKVNHSKNRATSPQATQPPSHHTITPDIILPMVTNTGNQWKQIHVGLYSLVAVVW